MIIERFADRIRCVTQNDHAAFASELLSLWRVDGMPVHPRRDTLLAAAREHDNGWHEIDSAPHVAPSGEPHDFRSLPQGLRRELWQRGVERFDGERPGVALLILQHAVALHRDRTEDPDWPPLVDRWRKRRRELLDDLELDDDALLADYRFIDLTDMLSLAVCDGWSEPFTIRDVQAIPRPIDPTTCELTLDPMPLAGTTSFRIACRFIDDRAYAGDADLAIALASAKWTSIHVRVLGSLV